MRSTPPRTLWIVAGWPVRRRYGMYASFNEDE
jgi:hypothetical protein